MPYAKGTRFLHICPQCHKERFLKRSKTSILCRSCSLREAQHRLHPNTFVPGSLYSQESLERFWRQVDKDTSCPCHPYEERCWLWTGHINKVNRYGYHSLGKSQPISAHVFAYTATYGPVEKGIYILHAPPCLLRHCVRHLYAGTQKQNSQDMGEKYGSSAWIWGGSVKLTDTDVRAIREARTAGATIPELAERFHVDPSTLYRICKRVIWKRVP